IMAGIECAECFYAAGAPSVPIPGEPFVKPGHGGVHYPQEDLITCTAYVQHIVIPYTSGQRSYHLDLPVGRPLGRYFIGHLAVVPLIIGEQAERSLRHAGYES